MSDQNQSQNREDKAAKTPKVYTNEIGESCYGFMLRVLIPVGILTAMRERGQYDNDSMPKKFLSDHLDRWFAPHVAEFEQGLDGSVLVEEFLSRPDLRQNRGVKMAKLESENDALKREIERLRAISAQLEAKV